MTAFAILFTLAAIGIAETSYLIKTRYAADLPICPMGGQCHLVLTSKYNSIFGVHNDVLGFLFYVSTGVIAAFLVLELRPIDLWWNILTLMVAGSTLMSIALTYIQWKILKHWCFWCLMSAATVLCMAIIVSLYWLTIL